MRFAVALLFAAGEDKHDALYNSYTVGEHLHFYLGMCARYRTGPLVRKLGCVPYVRRRIGIAYDLRVAHLARQAEH